MFRKSKIAIVAFILGIFLSFSTVAIAASTSSTVKNFGPYAGYYYSNYASIFNNNGINGSANITAKNGVNVPTGYMGVSSYLYNSSGVCVEYSDWYYNQTAANAMIIPTPTYYVTGSYYYADGITKVYNGNGYTSVYTNVTPNLYY